MKIVFTAKGDNWESQIDERFGRMEMLVFFDEETNTLEATKIDTEQMDHGAGLQTAQKVLNLHPDVIITGNGAGNKALDILKRSSVKMYIGANGMTLKEAYDAYKNNKLNLQF